MAVTQQEISTAVDEAGPTDRIASTLTATTKPLRVTLVGDDELTGRGLSAILGGLRNIELVRLTRSLVEPVDVALYDPAHVAATPSRPTLAQLLADSRIRRVVLFTWNFQPWSERDFLEQGAAAYLPKSLTGAGLAAALQAAHHNQRPGAGLARARARARANTGTPAANGQVLTEREAQVLSLICQGRSNTEVARTLALSVNTVKSYVRSTYRKIEVESRSRAVLWGLGHGFGASQGAGPGSDTSATTHP